MGENQKQYACAAVAFLHLECPNPESCELPPWRLCLSTGRGNLVAVDLWLSCETCCQVVFLSVDDDGWVTDVWSALEGSNWHSLERVQGNSIENQLKEATNMVKAARNG